MVYRLGGDLRERKRTKPLLVPDRSCLVLVGDAVRPFLYEMEGAESVFCVTAGAALRRRLEADLYVAEPANHRARGRRRQPPPPRLASSEIAVPMPESVQGACGSKGSSAAAERRVILPLPERLTLP